jgi:cyclophilin family peptidyl-prolyl cis-trans isomerase/HEAT repeat protein
VRRLTLSVIVVLLATGGVGRAQAPLRERMLVAEDRRSLAADEFAPLKEALAEGSLRRQAVRAIGRFERPELIPLIAPALNDGVGIRAEAAGALAQLARTPEAAAEVQTLLLARAALDAEAGLWEVWGEVAAALGRLPYGSADQAARTEAVLVAQLPSPDSFTEPETAAILGSVRGLESLVRVSRKIAVLQPATWDRLRWSATAQRPAADPRSAWIRRLAMNALLTGGEATTSIVERALADKDSEVRRLGAVTAGADGPVQERGRLLKIALADADPQVRLEGVRGWARQLQATDCAPVRAAVRDANPHVMLQAIDALGAPCPGADGAPELSAIVETLNASRPRTWHAPAHAIVSLARQSPAAARSALPRFAQHGTWQVRMYAARAAGVLSAVDVLTTLGSDPHPNVREAALTALLDLKRPEAVPAALSALTADDHQLVLTATKAFADRSTAPRSVPALLNALGRLTAQHKDTSRDPRMAILERLQALGDKSLAPDLEGYVKDFDARVAVKVADMLRAWTGTPRTASPQPLPAPGITLPAVEALRGARLRFIMGGTGQFEIALDPDFAPASALRIARRAGEGYYDGLTFHRVAANFVIQGGSPGANEYAGDARYMRDEVGIHRRGTVGISTRGRDTGDAQIFVNLVDSPRLDYQYTVFGTVVSGMDVVDAILEGDVIERVAVVNR